MKFYGLIGYPLSHSYSKQYFDSKFINCKIVDCCYDLIPIENISLLPEILKNRKYSGLNVTIPYKHAIIKFVDYCDDISSEVRAVNALKFEKDKIIGYNTDVYGFECSLSKVLKAHHDKALILGSGGSAGAVKYVLDKLGIDSLVVSRKPAGSLQISWQEIDKKLLSDYHLLINCTPVGMYPAENECPSIPYNYLTPAHLLFDLVYNPDETLFLRSGKAMGAQVQNGLNMLIIQAEESWRIWNSDQ